MVDGAYDSLCDGSEGVNSYCMEPGCYDFEVSAGVFPYEIGWQMCGCTGGAPYKGHFCVESNSCKFVCTEGAAVQVYMTSEIGTGWNRAYYTIYSAVGEVLYGGSLPSGSSGNHTICLPIGCSFLAMEAGTSYGKGVGFSVCGATGGPDDVVQLCVSETLHCTAKEMLPDPDCGLNAIPFAMFDKGAMGWHGNNLTVTSSTGAVVSRHALPTGFYGEDSMCLADGCYDVDVGGGDDEKDIFWYVCGVRGTAPWHAKMCLDKKHKFCYGLKNCPVLLSYAHLSDLQYYFVSHISDPSGASTLDAGGHLHGVDEVRIILALFASAIMRSFLSCVPSAMGATTCSWELEDIKP